MYFQFWARGLLSELNLLVFRVYGGIIFRNSLKNTHIYCCSIGFTFNVGFKEGTCYLAHIDFYLGKPSFQRQTPWRCFGGV